jgi:type IV secretion system protein TrbD
MAQETPEEPRRVPIRRVAARPALILGADREMVLMLSLIVGICTVWAMNWVAFGIGVTFWGLGLWAFRAMAKVDPWLRHLFIRSRRYQKFYPARSTPWRQPPAASWLERALKLVFRYDHRTHY